MLLIARLISITLFIVLLLAVLVIVIVPALRTWLALDNQAKSKAARQHLPSDAGIRHLIAEGKQDEAIRLYQQFTDVDQFTARHAVAEIVREMQQADALRQDIVGSLSKDGKAAAIESYQMQTGADLETALNYVENLEL